MRTITLILALVLGLGLLVPAQAVAETQVRVYWGFGVVIGGVSIFVTFASGDLSEKESDIKTAETETDENLLLARAITEHANISPVHYETPGTVTVFRW